MTDAIFGAAGSLVSIHDIMPDGGLDVFHIIRMDDRLKKTADEVLGIIAEDFFCGGRDVDEIPVSIERKDNIDAVFYD